MVQPFDMSLEALEAYKPELTRQPDFEDFWKATLEELEKVPRKYELRPYDYPARGIKVFRISFLGFMNANIDGWLAMPDTSEKLPGLVLYHGYNWAMDGCVHDAANMALHGYAVLQMLVRGQQGGSVDNVVPSHGNYAGWMSKGILSKEEYYYRAVYMDAVRAVEILAGMDETDGGRIGVAGGSQGGALTLAAAALSDIPAAAVAQYPYLCHFNRAIDVALKMPYGELNEFFRRHSDPSVEKNAKITLSYFDIMNHAPNIKCPVLVSAGLIDEITPPSTIFAAYNHMTCPKEIAVYRYFGHEYIPGFVEKQLRMLMKHLQRP